MQAVADAIGLQLAQRAPDRLRANGLAGMDREPQAMFRGVFVHFAELLRAGAAFVAANADAYHIVRLSRMASSTTRCASSTPKWRTASRIQYSDMPKSRSPRWRPRSAPSNSGANS